MLAILIFGAEVFEKQNVGDSFDGGGRPHDGSISYFSPCLATSLFILILIPTTQNNFLETTTRSREREEKNKEVDGLMDTYFDESYSTSSSSSSSSTSKTRKSLEGMLNKPSLLPPSKLTSSSSIKDNSLSCLPALRFLAGLQVLGFFFYSTTGDDFVDNFNRWGSCSLTFFFLLSGFVFGYAYGGRNTSHRIDWWDFMAKRFANLYPLYIFSLMLGR